MMLLVSDVSFDGIAMPETTEGDAQPLQCGTYYQDDAIVCSHDVKFNAGRS